MYVNVQTLRPGDLYSGLHLDEQLDTGNKRGYLLEAVGIPANVGVAGLCKARRYDAQRCRRQPAPVWRCIEVLRMDSQSGSRS